jgi:hypothetical protein
MHLNPSDCSILSAIYALSFSTPNGQQISLPIGCTTLAEEDPYIHFSDSQGLFRVPDLLALIEVLAWLTSQCEATSPQNT